MKTDALKQALDKWGFDAAFGGARRDEEKSRAKERIFSFRSAGHVWDPRNQRPELWNLYNTRINKGETIRVFPLSNWTELDIWQYTRAAEHSGRAAVLRRAAAGGEARWPADHARRRAHAAAARRGRGDARWCGSARSAAIRCPRPSRARLTTLDDIIDEMLRGAHVRALRPAHRHATRRPRWRRRSARGISDDRLRAAARDGRAPEASGPDQSLLRFLTCGSVDDGKSTLIGRLLYDTKLILEDQLRRAGARQPQARHDRRRHRSSRCSSTAWKPSASRASPSMSPIASSPRRGAPSSSRIRRGTSSTRATWRPALPTPTRRSS